MKKIVQSGFCVEVQYVVGSSENKVLRSPTLKCHQFELIKKLSFSIIEA